MTDQAAIDCAAAVLIDTVFAWKRESGPDWTSHEIAGCVIDALVKEGHVVSAAAADVTCKMLATETIKAVERAEAAEARVTALEIELANVKAVKVKTARGDAATTNTNAISSKSVLERAEAAEAEVKLAQDKADAHLMYRRAAEDKLEAAGARGDAAVALLREAVEAFVIRHVDDWEAKVLPETLDKWRAFLETEGGVQP